MAYLSEAQRADTPDASQVFAAVPGSAEHGAILYEDLGCIGCHTFAAPNIEYAAHDDEHRISLFDVSHKYRPGALQAFLRNPRQHFAANRMPDFRLSAPEAADLEEYLRANTQDSPLPNGVKQRPGDAKRGKEKFQELKCQQCHIDPGATSGTLSAPYRSAVAPSVDADAQGCLATDAEQSARYSLHDDERLALMDYLANRDTFDQLNHNAPVQLLDRTTRLVRQLRCTACHDLDHQRARLPGVLSEEGTRGQAPESFPSLTWAGEKLHETWLVKFIAGEINEPQRPWLKGRMPSFPHFAPTLAQGLRTHHGITTEADDLIVDAQLVEVGQRLASEQGFHCLQCHSAQLRPQDNQGNIAPAIPFAKVRARLRHEYYQRFVLDPSRFDLNTKMPKLSLDGKTTSLRSIYGGDAARQFEALWHFMQRDGGE